MELLIYCILYFLLAFVWRSVLVYRRTGINPLVIPTGDDAYSYVGRAFKVITAATAAAVILPAFYPPSLSWFVPIPSLMTSGVHTAGWCILLASLLWLLVAQGQMGASWRIGIDEKNVTALVQHGLYRYSRNPIFLGMRLNLLGLFLVIPNAITLCVGVAGELAIQVQVRLEEAHLSGLHGQRYRDYQDRVRRWL